MTSVSGYDIVTAPCCGARFRKLKFQSVAAHLLDMWSDGYVGGHAGLQISPVVWCACGRYLRSSDLAVTDYLDGVSFLDERNDEEAQLQRLPPIPYLSALNVFSLVISGIDALPEDMACMVRLLLWQHLNTPDRRYPNAPTGPGSAHHWRMNRCKAGLIPHFDVPIDLLSPDQIGEIYDANLRALTPMLMRHFASLPLLIGDSMRAQGAMQDAIDWWDATTEPSDSAAQLRQLALDGNRKVALLSLTS